jgi:hypothetical protein
LFPLCLLVGPVGSLHSMWLLRIHRWLLPYMMLTAKQLNQPINHAPDDESGGSEDKIIEIPLFLLNPTSFLLINKGKLFNKR